MRSCPGGSNALARGENVRVNVWNGLHFRICQHGAWALKGERDRGPQETKETRMYVPLYDWYDGAGQGVEIPFGFLLPRCDMYRREMMTMLYAGFSLLSLSRQCLTRRLTNQHACLRTESNTGEDDHGVVDGKLLVCSSPVVK